MKVSELKYERLTLEAFAQEIQDIIAQVKNAASAYEVRAARNRCNDQYIRLETAQALSYMRYSINTADEFYLAEKDYYDEMGPQAQNYLQEYTKAMLAGGQSWLACPVSPSLRPPPGFPVSIPILWDGGYGPGTQGPV